MNMNKEVRKQLKEEGFTLIELMIVIAIIGILAAIALPAYQTYTKKAKFTEVVTATTSVKSAIDICYQTKGTLAVCDTTDTAAVANAESEAAAGDDVASVVVTDDTAVITATGGADVDGETYILVPTATGGTLVWNLDTTNSTCLAAGICDER